MSRTVIASASRTVLMGFDQPFCVIGERINPTGRKTLAAEMVAGNFATVFADALAQVAAGALVLDVNAGVTAVNPNETEPALLARTIELVQGIVDVPLCIDSSVPAALAAGLAVAKGRPLVNSVTGEEDRLEAILPLIKKYDVPVVAISNDESGISEDPDVRFAVAKKIVERAMDHGIKREDVVVDPLVMPIGAMNSAGRQVFHLLRRLREELKVNSTCGASNISFGIPNRRVMNAHFLSMAAGAGLTSAIMNPLHREDMDGIRAANTLLGVDPDCRAWLAASRPAPEAGAAPGDGGEGRRERRVGRRQGHAPAQAAQPIAAPPTPPDAAASPDDRST